MSKILLLSAGTRPESKNNKAAGIVNSYLSDLEISCNLYDDFYENVPFLRDYNDEQPEYVIKVRDDLIETVNFLKKGRSDYELQNYSYEQAKSEINTSIQSSNNILEALNDPDNAEFL